MMCHPVFRGVWRLPTCRCCYCCCCLLLFGQVYAIDLLGQGQSWPTQVQCQASGPLCYSADTWTEQLFHFIEEKIGQPVYIAGNSLGEAPLSVFSCTSVWQQQQLDSTSAHIATASTEAPSSMSNTHHLTCCHRPQTSQPPTLCADMTLLLLAALLLP